MNDSCRRIKECCAAVSDKFGKSAPRKIVVQQVAPISVQQSSQMIKNGMNWPLLETNKDTAAVCT